MITIKWPGRSVPRVLIACGNTAARQWPAPVECCFTSTETVRTITYGRGAQDVHLDFHTAPDLCQEGVSFQCCFTSTENVRTIRDGEPRTATSTFTLALSSDTCCSVLLYVQGDHKDC